MGSCSGAKCAEINPNSRVEELDTANRYVGITYCTESCGGIGCSCGFPSSGCLFYRVYHVPVDDELFEVFHCPTWNQKVGISYEETTWQRKPKTCNIELLRSVRKSMTNTEIEVASIETPPLPLLTSTFIHNSRHTARLEQNYDFSYACILRLNSSTKIHDEECTIQDTCSCNPAEDSISCYCQHNNVSQYMSIDHILPLRLPNSQIATEGKNSTVTVRTSDAALELALLIDSKLSNIKLNIDRFQCEIKTFPIHGCYKCIKGAVIHIDCQSNIENAIAEVECNSQSFTLRCTKKGYRNEIHFYSNTAQFYEICHARCETHRIFTISGQLHFINENRPIHKLTALNGNESNSNNAFLLELPDFTNFWTVIRQYIIFTISICLVVFAILVLSIMAIDKLISSPISSGRRRQARPSQNITTFLLPFPIGMVLKAVSVLRAVTRLILTLPLRVALRLAELL